MVTKFRITDVIPMIAVMLLAVVILLIIHAGGGHTADTAVIHCDGGETAVSLENDTEGTVESGGYTMKYRVSDGSICVCECDCPDKVCVRTGKISKPGETVVCMPAHIVITLTGGAGDESADIKAG